MYFVYKMVTCPSCNGTHDLCVEAKYAPSMLETFLFECPSTKTNTKCRNMLVAAEEREVIPESCVKTLHER